MEWPLPLWLVLREELAELRPPVAARVETFAAVVEQSSTPPARDESAKYLFSARDVLDLDRLKTKMAERAPELAKLSPAKPAAAEIKTFATAPQITREEVRA